MSSIAPWPRRRGFSVVVIGLAVMGLSSRASMQAPAQPSWAGWARCQVDVQGPGYTERQIHTWTSSGGTPTVEGAFRVYPGTWSVVGGGSLQRTQGTQTLVAQWAINGTMANAPLAVFVRASDGRMLLQARHAQLRAAGAVAGYQQQIIEGKPQTPGQLSGEGFEFAFPLIDAPATDRSVSGSSSPQVNGSIGYMQPGGSRGSAACTWTFGQGIAAPAPPPALAAVPVPVPVSTTVSAGAPAPPVQQGPAPPGQTTPGQTQPGQAPPVAVSLPPGIPTISAPTGLPTAPRAPDVRPPILREGSTAVARVHVLSPNGSEDWAGGQPRYVIWTHDFAPEQLFDVDASIDRGVTWTAVLRNLKPVNLSVFGVGQVGWMLSLPAVTSATALIRVNAAGLTVGGDISDAVFNLVPGTARISAPVGGVSWTIGGPSGPIEWTHNLAPQTGFNVELSRDGGATWTAIGGQTGSAKQEPRSWVWPIVSGPETLRARVRVRSYTGGFGGGGPPSIVAESPNFTIAASR